MKPDLDQIDRDRREHRHPRPRCIRPAIELAPRRPVLSDSVELHCPICRGPVYAPADSERERVDCAACGAACVTRRGLDGAVAIELDVGGDA